MRERLFTRMHVGWKFHFFADQLVEMLSVRFYTFSLSLSRLHKKKKNTFDQPAAQPTN